MLFVCLSSLVACISQTLWPCPPPHSLSRTPWAPDSLLRHLQFLLSTFLLVHPLSIDLLGEITCLLHIRSEYNAHVANSLLVLFTILEYNKVPVKVHLTRCLSPLCYICSEKKDNFLRKSLGHQTQMTLFYNLFPLFSAYIANRVTDKLTPVTDRVFCCRSGSAAATQAIADIAKYHLNFIR